MDQAPLVIHATDRPGWCFENIAKSISRELSQQFRHKITTYSRVGDGACDVAVSYCWEQTLRVKASLRARAIIPCLYDHLSWSINETSLSHLKSILKHSTLLFVCNERMAEEVRQKCQGMTLPPIVVVEDGVDHNLFRYGPLPDKFACGWVGMSTRMTPGGPEDHKGLGIMREACAISGAELRVLDAASGGAWPLSRMPVFYQDTTVYLVASYTEGTPNPLLEALSCGRPVISTRVGLAPKIIVDGVNGFLVDRDAKAMAEAILKIKSLDRPSLRKMGEEARRSVSNYGWNTKAQVWKVAFARAMAIGASSPPVSAKLAPIEVVVTPPAVTTAADAVPPSVVSARTRYRGGSIPRVLLISDVRNWAFHTNMKDLAEYLQDDFLFEHWFVAEWQRDGKVPDFDEFDVVFNVYHRWQINGLLPWDRVVGSLRAFWFTPERGLNPPGQEEFNLVNRHRAFHVVTQANYNQLIEHCPNVVYLTNPVNTTRFTTPTAVTGEIIASWNGNNKHASGSGLDVKGFSSIVVPSCIAANVPLISAEYNTTRIPSNEMPAFYGRSNVAVCASLYEGASNSVMEAMACGLAVVATDVGNHREMQESQLKHFHDSGIVIVERSIEGVSSALAALKKNPSRAAVMGDINRREILERWSWAAWRDRYAAFLQKGLLQ